VNKLLSIVLSIVILSLLVAAPALAGGGADEPTDTSSQTTSATFNDVPQNHWAYEDLKYLSQRGIITGLPGGTYNGSDPLDRYSAAAIIARAVRYLQNDPESVTPQDLNVLNDLIYKVSDELTTLQQEMDQAQQSISQLGAGDGASIVKKVDTNFIIAVTGVLVGLAAVALATLFQ